MTKKKYFLLFLLLSFLILIAAFLLADVGEEKNPEISPNCSKCKSLTGKIREFTLKKYGVSGLYFVLKLICSRFLDKEVCSGAIENYGGVVLDSIIKRSIDSDRICTSIKFCKDPIPFISKEAYAKRVLSNKPPTKIVPLNKTAPELKVVQVSDIHLDLRYKEGTIVDCGKPLCCHKPPGKDEKNVKLGGKYGAIGKCDGVLEVVREFAIKAKEIKPDFILFTGDNEAHAVWEVEQSQVVETTRAAIDEMVSVLGKDIPIFPTIGNHEKAPVDQFYGKEEVLLHGLADIFKPYLTKDAYETFKEYGYYSMNYKDTNLRLVSLNCIMCDSFNWYLLFDTSQPKKMFDWLEEVLDKAEKKGEIVYIIDHIPMVHSQHTFQCAFRLKVLLERYQNIIRGYISAHTHKEFITLIKDSQTKKPFIVNYITSALSSYEKFNPSFRNFIIDSSTYHIKDLEQYRLDLLKSNELRKPIWNYSYKASEFFNVTDLTDIEGISKVNVPGRYLFIKYGETEYAKSIENDPEMIKLAECQLKYDTYEEVKACLKKGFEISEEYLHYILNKWGGDWREDK